MNNPNPRPLRFGEMLAYGCGNAFPTIVTATGGLAMFFYTDVVGLSAALVGSILLLVRFGDAVWDLAVGRWVDRSRGRMGQCRPFLLWAAPLMGLAFVAAYTVPPFESSGAKLAAVIVAYTALWWFYSVVNIPFQAMPALVAPDPDRRLRLLGVNAFAQFLMVVACGAGFPMMKDGLAAGDPAHGFRMAAMIFGTAGVLLTWITVAFVRERVESPPARSPDIRGDLKALFASRAWRVCMLSFALLASLIGLPLAAGVYYFSAVLKAPAMIGPFMGLSGMGLIAGVMLSDRLTRRFCKRRVLVGSTFAMGLVSMGYLATMNGPMPTVLALAVIGNLLLGLGAPITQSLLADTADAIERDTGRRVLGTLFATIGFGQKIGAGAASAIVGLMLSSTGYLAGKPEQPPEALLGIAALMGPVTGALALAIAVIVGFGYPYGREEVERLRDELAALRAGRATAAAA